MKYFSFVLFLLVSSPVFAQFSAGDGTPENPWHIRTLEDLIKVSDYPDKHFIQKANIRKPLTKPLCSDWSRKFTGSYNGNGYLINLAIDIKDTLLHPAALFAFVSGNAVIKNVVTTGYVRGWAFVAGIVALALPTVDGTAQILNCINNAELSINLERVGSISGIADGNTKNLVSNKNLNLGTILSSSQTAIISGVVRNSTWEGAITLSNSINSGLIVDNSTWSDLANGTGGVASVLFPQNNFLKKLFQCINTGVIINNSNANPPRIIKGIAHTP